MKRQQLRLAAAAAFSLVLFGSRLALAAEPSKDEHEHGAEMPDAEKEIVKVTDQGLSPSTITLKKLDGSVFFVNTTKDSLVTVSINFGEHTAHCASSNLKFENGSMHSVEPIGPKDFALTCFPQKGTYEVKVDGVSGKSGPVIGKVIVP